MRDYATDDFELKNSVEKRNDRRSTLLRTRMPLRTNVSRGRKKRVLNEGVLTNTKYCRISRRQNSSKERNFLFSENLTCPDSHWLETILPNFLEYLPLFVNGKNLRCTFLYVYLYIGILDIVTIWWNVAFEATEAKLEFNTHNGFQG